MLQAIEAPVRSNYLHSAASTSTPQQLLGLRGSNSGCGVRVTGAKWRERRLILFAVHLLLIGYLAYRSGFMATGLGILLVLAGLGYLLDGLGTLLMPGYSVSVAQFTFVGEVALIFWLLIRGRRDQDSPAYRPPSTVRDRAPSGV